MSKLLENASRCLERYSAHDGEEPDVVGAIESIIKYLKSKEDSEWESVIVVSLPREARPWTHQAVGSYRSQFFYGNGQSEKQAMETLKEQIL